MYQKYIEPVRAVFGPLYVISIAEFAYKQNGFLMSIAAVLAIFAGVFLRPDNHWIQIYLRKKLWLEKLWIKGWVKRYLHGGMMIVSFALTLADIAIRLCNKI